MGTKNFKAFLQGQTRLAGRQRGWLLAKNMPELLENSFVCRKFVIDYNDETFKIVSEKLLTSVLFRHSAQEGI